LHRRTQIDRDQLLEGLASFTIIDRDQVLNPLVQRNADVRGAGILLDELSAIDPTVLTTSPKRAISFSKSRCTKLAATMFSSRMAKPSCAQISGTKASLSLACCGSRRAASFMAGLSRSLHSTRSPHWQDAWLQHRVEILAGSRDSTFRQHCRFYPHVCCTGRSN